MKLQRWHVARGGLDTIDCLDERGDWVRWADVLAWRDSIQAAVDAERNAAAADTGNASGWIARTMKARKALDALLTDGDETVHQCPPTHSGGIMPCCGRTPFEVTGDRMADDPKLVTCKGRTS